MSSNEDVELKAGHPPAVKAGGMRVARTRQSSSGEPAKVDPAEQEEYADPPPKEDASVLVSGAVAKGDKDFPAEAVKQYHDKPVPSKQNRPPIPQQKHHIQQPR